MDEFYNVFDFYSYEQHLDYKPFTIVAAELLNLYENQLKAMNQTLYNKGKWLKSFTILLASAINSTKSNCYIHKCSYRSLYSESNLQIPTSTKLFKGNHKDITKYEIAVRNRYKEFGIKQNHILAFIETVTEFNMFYFIKGKSIIDEKTKKKIGFYNKIHLINPIHWNIELFTNKETVFNTCIILLSNTYFDNYFNTKKEPFIPSIIRNKFYGFYEPASKERINMINKLNNGLGILKDYIPYQQIFLYDESKGGRLFSKFNLVKRYYRDFLIDLLGNKVMLDFKSCSLNILHILAIGKEAEERMYNRIAYSIAYDSLQRSLKHKRKKDKMDFTENDRLKVKRLANKHRLSIVDKIKVAIQIVFNSHLFNKHGFFNNGVEELISQELIQQGLLNTDLDKSNAYYHCYPNMTDYHQVLRDKRQRFWKDEKLTMTPRYTVTLLKILNAIIKEYPELYIYVGKKTSNLTQYIESQVITKIGLQLIEDGQLPLLIHDGFIVDVSLREKYEALMEQYLLEAVAKYKDDNQVYEDYYVLEFIDFIFDKMKLVEIIKKIDTKSIKPTVKTFFKVNKREINQFVSTRMELLSFSLKDLIEIIIEESKKELTD